MEYKKQRNEVHRLIRKAKVGFFNDKIAENRNDPRKLWKTLKLLGYTKTVKTKSFNLNLDIEGTVISDQLTVANSLNNYFTTIVNTLVKKLPNQAGLYGDNHVQQFYLQKGVQADTFSLMKVSNDSIFQKLNSLNPNKATGTFPTEFKRARVAPLYKKGSKLEQGNYRPVSIPCCLSKIIERVVYEQIKNYFLAKSPL